MLLFALKFIVPRLSKIILSYLTFTLKLWDQNGDKWCVRNTIYHSCKYWPKIKLIPRQFFSDDETIKDVKVSTELYIICSKQQKIFRIYIIIAANNKSKRKYTIVWSMKVLLIGNWNSIVNELLVISIWLD